MATENDSPTNLASACLTSAMHRLMLDPDLANLTVTCGDKEWKVHSAILAVRSPFFKAAVTNSFVEKRDMKIDIKEFDPDAMDEVIKFMYGVPTETGHVKFLLEAARRFQMEDLKEYAVKIAKKELTVDNVVELAHIAELYGMEDFFAHCANFIVENDVPLSREDMSPKLAQMVVTILKDANQKLNGRLQECENKLKAEAEWMWLDKLKLNGQQLEYVGLVHKNDIGSALAMTSLSISNHYFEIEIIDFRPSFHGCSIVDIGLATKDFPRDKIPLFTEGSIGYGTNGYVYMDGGVSELFGPRCKKGDVMGCGIIFPRDYEFKFDDEGEQEKELVQVYRAGMKAQVYFTRNGKLLGMKEVVLPKGGFFPTVMMKGLSAKVRVDLKPDSVVTI